MSSEFKQKAWTADEEAETQLAEIRKDLGNINASAAIRYCIKKVFKELQKKGA